MIFIRLISRWRYAYIGSYNHTTRQHLVKQYQTIRSLNLGQYRVRLCNDMNELERHYEHTPVNNSVIEVRRGIRCYKSLSDPTNLQAMDYHSFPQVVRDLLKNDCSFI